MTRRLYRRDSAFMKIVSMMVAFMFVMSIAGTGVAVPVVPETATSPESTTGEVSPVPEAVPPAEEPAEEPAVEPSVEAQPTTSEPQLVSGAPATEARSKAASRRTPAPSTAPLALAAVTLPYADFTDVDWEAYRISPASQVGWAKSNLGEYREGDWIPVRIIVDNVGGASDVRLPAFDIEFDHYDDGKNAIGVDTARGYKFWAGTPLQTGPNPPAGSTTLDGMSGADGGASATFDISYSPAGDIVIPRGQYGVVSFEVHLALTPYWQQKEGKNGARAYPGSSAQGRFITWNGTGTGQKTISVPVGAGTIPTGRVDGLKFNDLNENGTKESNEPGLAGWNFTLEYGGEFPFTMTATSASSPLGAFSFTELPAGSYTITEAQQSPWVSSTPNPLAFSLARDEVKPVKFGNYLPDMTKTWVLSIDTLPQGAEPYVTYSLNGVSTTTTLSGPPFQASVDAEVGSTITDIKWYVRWMGEEILLGTMADEVLDEDLTNTFPYDSCVAGMKFHDLDGDAMKDAGEPGLSGWTIVLKRVMGGSEVTYAQTVTGAGGAYSFADVLPGTYKVYETNQSGWYNTVAPLGSFTVGNGSAVSDKDFGNLEVLSDIDVDKTGPTFAHVGDTVPYVITVTNSGNYLLTNILVTDPTLGLSQTIPSLAPGASTVINADYVVAVDDPDPLPNTASALGIDVLGNPVSDDDDHMVDIIHPEIQVVKTVAPGMAVNPADVVYTYEVTNIGDDPLTDVTLVDDKLTVPGGASIGTLNPGASATLFANATLTSSTTNIATAAGVDSLGMSVDDDDSADVAIYNPSISIVKSADPVVIIPGSLVAYTYVVTNTGDIALSNVSVVDDKLGPVGTLGMLGAGQSTTFMAYASIDADVTNIGTVTGDYGTPETEFFGTVTASSSAEVDVVHPAVTIVKTASSSPVVAGTTVEYTYTVRNTGDVALYDLAVTDDILGAIGTIPMLAVGDETFVTASSELDETTTNIGTVLGYDAHGHPATDSDDETVVVYNPAITIEKTVSDETVLSGETVTYTYVVTNTGDIDLFDIEVTDDILGDIDTIPSLAAGASATLTEDAVITADVTNIGTAVGYYGEAESGFYGSVTDSDPAEVDMVSPAVEVVKSASPTRAVAGTLITYTYVVENTGDVTLYDLVVTDDKLGVIGTIDELAVGASTTLTATSTLTETTTNTVLVEGYDGNENPVSDDDTFTVPVYNPAISIVKSASPITIIPGTLVAYTYIVTNTGDIDLFDVEVTDDILGPVDTVAALAVGESVTFMAYSNPTADVTNVGTVTASYGEAESDFFGTVTASDDAVVDVTGPAISIVKTVSEETVLSGETVTYTYVITNTGDIGLFDIEVTDDILGDIDTIPSLAAGASWTLTKDAVVTADVTNTGTAIGYYGELGSDFYGWVTDADTAEVDVVSPAISIVKSADVDNILTGELVTYTYMVTNTGDIPLTNVTVTDDIIGPIATIPVLSPGETVPVTAPVNVAVDTLNIGTATGTYGGGDFTGTVTDSDDAFVNVVSPAMTVEKFVSANPVLSGSTVTYTYLVTNTGDVPLVDVELVDDVLGAVGTVDYLVPGDSRTYTIDSTLDQTITNVVTGTATDEYGHAVDGTDSVTVDVFSPSIDVVKTVSSEVVLAGETVTYTYVVRNTGDIALSDVRLSDDRLGDLGNLGTMEPGESQTVTADAAIDTDTTNIATVEGDYGFVESQFFGTVSDTDDAFVDVVTPAIDVVKTASPTEIFAGETVVYSYTVTNIGDVPLNDVTLTDDKLGAIGTLPTLAVGASAQFSESAALSVPTTNVVEAVGTDDFGHVVSDTDDAFVDVAAPFTPPNLVIDKSADKTTVKAGDTVRYTVTYENIGEGTAADMVITDDYDERYVTVTDAAGGVVAGGKITWNVAGPLTAEDGPQTITYTVKVDEDLPSSVTRIRNTVVIFEPTEEDTDDNTDSWEVDVTGDPFLPFTGSEWLLLLGVAAAATTAGAALRRAGRKNAA